MSASPSLDVVVPGNHLMVSLLGQRDRHLRQIEQAFPNTTIRVRGNEVSIAGPDAERVGRLFDELVVMLQRSEPIDESNLARAITMVHTADRPSEVLTDDVLRGAKGKTVRPKTTGQKRYVDAIRTNVITFGIGPAGTGKSWLAVAMAVQAFQAKQVQRIILTRPAVEAGERLGFLPGDLDGQDRSVPASAVRRVARHGRPRGRAAHDGEAGGRGRTARLHARSHAEQQLHHSRRGTEHDARADEDVPHPHRVRVQGA